VQQLFDDPVAGLDTLTRGEVKVEEQNVRVVVTRKPRTSSLRPAVIILYWTDESAYALISA
jgi:hypothetical protein